MKKRLLFIVLLVLVLGAVPASAKNPIGHRADPDDEWDKSSLYFTDGCLVNCKIIQTQVCNGGEEDMAGPTGYEIWFSATGNPQDGERVTEVEGIIEPLAAGECITLTYAPTLEGNYMFRVLQRPGHPGTGDLWSEGCHFIICPTAVEAELKVSVNGREVTIEISPPEVAEGGILTLEQGDVTTYWDITSPSLTIEIEEGPGKLTFWSPWLLEGPIFAYIP